MNSRPRHPPHLKGKEIGLFYARRQREKREEEDMAKDMLEVPDEQIARINRFLKQIPLNAFQHSNQESDFLAAYRRNLSLNANSSDRIQKDLLRDPCEGTSASMPKEPCQKTPTVAGRFLAQFRRNLPAYSMREELVKLVHENNVVVLSGETGCGKTTQVPQYIFEEFENARIVCTQPRRISAITVAQSKFFRHFGTKFLLISGFFRQIIMETKCLKFIEILSNIR